MFVSKSKYNHALDIIISKENECLTKNNEITNLKKDIELHEKFLFEVHKLAHATNNTELNKIIKVYDQLSLSEARKNYFDLLNIAEAKNIELQDTIDKLRTEMKTPSLFNGDNLAQAEILFLKGENEKLKKELENDNR